LKPWMKITAYNHHARLLSSRASWSFSRNQFTQVEGADAVMQSFIAASCDERVFGSAPKNCLGLDNLCLAHLGPPREGMVCAIPDLKVETWSSSRNSRSG
jgi:hypothetical protein